MRSKVCAATALAAACAGLVLAQAPPGGAERGPARMPRAFPLMAALDADEDGEISAAEMEKAAAALETLDKNVRIATHPLDGDNIPYYSGRATMGGFETLQPWFVDAWRRQRERAEATLRALYSDDKSEVLRYANDNGVTHFLVNRARYRRNFLSKSGSFQPFTDYAHQILRGKRLENLVLADPPRGAVVFEYEKWAVVDVERLKLAWVKGKG